MKTPLSTTAAPLRGTHKKLLKPGLVVAVTGVLAMLCCGGAISAVIFGDLTTNPSNLSNTLGCGGGKVVDVNEVFDSIGPYSSGQVHNAAVIVKTGQELEVPPYGWVIAVATAMQESSLTNHGHLGERNDHDSLGLFQQRPSQGWGTPEQIMDPVYAATKFYQKLLQVEGWESMALTNAAQRVQVSAYPSAYAKHQSLATEIVNRLTGGAGRAVLSNGKLRCAGFGEIAASGWTAPVAAAVVSGFRTSHRPSHHGVDLGASRGDPIRAAASGVVSVSRCDVGACDRDGSPSTPGCGWFVEVLHPGQVMTRYCHMNTQPYVRVGDRVNAGETLGIVGTTGNSSGPHLHFEVHLHGDRSSHGAVDPVSYMAQKGAPLGKAAV